MNKIYIWLVVLLIVLIVIIVSIGIYWNSQRTNILQVLPIEEELTIEEESLNQDIVELEGIEKDTSFENLDQDLTEIIGDKEKIEIDSIKNMENELSLEFSSLSNDLSGLKELESDKLLDNLDSELSSIE